MSVLCDWSNPTIQHAADLLFPNISHDIIVSSYHRRAGRGRARKGDCPCYTLCSFGLLSRPTLGILAAHAWGSELAFISLSKCGVTIISYLYNQSVVGIIFVYSKSSTTRCCCCCSRSLLRCPFHAKYSVSYCVTAVLLLAEGTCWLVPVCCTSRVKQRDGTPLVKEVLRWFTFHFP